VYVFTRSAFGSWSQQAYLKNPSATYTAGFGEVVAVNANGNTIAVGEDDTVYIFTRTGSQWSHQASLRFADYPSVGEDVELTLSLSDSGNALAVGRPEYFHGDMEAAGGVHVLARRGTYWSQTAFLTASEPQWENYFGWSVDLSGDGNTLAVGAVYESSAATGVNGDESDDSRPYSGAVYVFTRSGPQWSQQAFIKASNSDYDDRFGWAVSLSADGDTLAVGAPWENGSATHVNGDQALPTISGSGAAYVFVRSGSEWSQQAYVKAFNTSRRGLFGWALALSSDGNRLAVSAVGEDGTVAGVAVAPTTISANDSLAGGAAYLYERYGAPATWAARTYIKASNPGPDDRFGYSLGLSGDGETLAIGAPFEDSAATGIDGNQVDDSASHAGAVYLY
jgi:trimeric autotransporter adhesin